MTQAEGRFLRWAAFDMDDPVKRITFGSQEQAEGFVRQVPGWDIVCENEPEWLPLPGEPGWKGWPDRSHV